MTGVQTSANDIPDASGMLVCVGDLLVDVLVTSRTLRDGMARGIHIRSGGSSANVAAWAARAGVRTAWMGTVGDDPSGRMLVEELRRANVQPMVQFQEGVETGVVISRLGRRANRVMYSARWASDFPFSDDQIEALSRAAAIHVTGYTGSSERLGISQLRRVVQTAESAGAFLSFDPSDPHLIRDMKPDTILGLFRSTKAGVIFANAQEACELTGFSSPTDAAALLLKSAHTAVVKDGGRGCVLASADGIVRVPAVRVVPIDTTGAGDAFAGTWLAHHLRGMGPVNSAREASAAAAAVITQAGARPPVD